MEGEVRFSTHIEQSPTKRLLSTLELLLDKQEALHKDITAQEDAISGGQPFLDPEGTPTKHSLRRVGLRFDEGQIEKDSNFGILSAFFGGEKLKKLRASGEDLLRIQNEIRTLIGKLSSDLSTAADFTTLNEHELAVIHDAITGNRDIDPQFRFLLTQEVVRRSREQKKSA